jgi:hypothetical protein
MIYHRNQNLSLKKICAMWNKSLHSIKRFEYYAPYSWHESISERKEWLIKNCKGDVYITHNCNERRIVYCFEKKEDATLYKLTWK